MKEINVTDANRMLQSNEAILVDVRENDEFSQEHIKNAINIPLTVISESLIKNMSKDKKIIVSCLSGKRANNVCTIIKSLQTNNTYILQGGLNAWKKQFSTVKSSKVGISIFRQVLITTGALVFTGTVLGTFISPLWFLVPTFIGLGLIFSGTTGTCTMANILQKMPWNKSE